MHNTRRITAIVGTYRKGGVIDTAVDEILAAAEQEGAAVEKIYLIDKHIEFCTNCRACTQQEGSRRGECCMDDDMAAILDSVQRSDAIVLASPMNFGTVTAVMKRFVERLVSFAYWPWGAGAPKLRDPRKSKLAVLVASSAAPGWMARLLTPLVGLLKKAAKVLGAKPVAVLFIGPCAQHPTHELSERTRKKARRLGKKLALHQ